MQKEKLRAIFLAAIMAMSMVAIGAAPVAAQDEGEINIVFDPVDGEVEPDSEVTYDINIEGADNNVQAYDFTVEIDDVDVAEITDAELVEFGGQFGSVDIAEDGSSVTFEEAAGDEDAEDEDFTIATVTLTSGADEGEAALSVDEDAEVQDNDGNAYDIDLGTASLTVAEEEDNGNDNGEDDNGDAPDTDDVDRSFDDYGQLLDESPVWQGQVVEVGDFDPDATVNLRERIDADTDRLRDQLRNDDGTVRFDTEDRSEGDYFLSGVGDRDNTFEILEQSLTAEFDEDEVTDEGQDSTTEFEFDSNRGEYPITIHAEGDLDVDELTSIFEDQGPFTVVDSAEGDDGETDYDEISLADVEDDDEYEVGFLDIEPGEYDFTFVGTDSTAEDSDSITVIEEDRDADFSQGVYQGTAGDIVEFELELEDTDDAWVQIGSEESDFIDIVYVEADDDDEPVSFQVNTRMLGTNAPSDEVYEFGDNVDDHYSAIHDEVLLAGNFVDDDGDDLGDNGDFADYLEELDIIDDIPADRAKAGQAQLTRPAQPTDYELIAADQGDDGVFIVDDGASEADNELDNAVLELIAPDIGEITTHVAPSEDADEDDNLDDLLDVVTQREDVAIDDRLVVQVEATGLYGVMVNQADDGFDILEDGTSGATVHDITRDGNLNNEGINFFIEGDDAVGNQDPTSVALEDADEDDVFVIVDNDGGQFFVVVNSDSSDAFNDGTPSDADTFEAELEYETDDDRRPRFERDDDGVIQDPFDFTFQDVRDNVVGFPYLSADSDITSTAEFTWEDAAISFDNLNADDEIQAENIDDSEISGTTNIAPGSSAELRVSSTDASSSFRIGQSVDIDEDGDVSAEYDFSGQEVGDEFDTRFRVSGSNVDTVDSVLVAEGDLGVEDPVDDEADDEDDVVDDDEDVVDDDDDVVDDDDDVEEPTDDETPGFGALVALVALIGAALLAVRRQNN